MATPSFLSNLLANSSLISKTLVSVAQTAAVCLTTHSWTGVPSIISYAMTALVYMVPNAKASAAVNAVVPDAEAIAQAIINAMKPAPAPAATPTTTAAFLNPHQPT
jgi:hypothetical protein